MIDIRDLLYKIVLNYIRNIMRESMINAISLSTISIVSYDPEREAEMKKEADILTKALMLPLPVKDIKIENNKVVLEIGEEAGSDS